MAFVHFIFKLVQIFYKFTQIYRKIKKLLLSWLLKKFFYNRFECVSFLKIEERVVISINNDKSINNFVQTDMVQRD